MALFDTIAGLASIAGFPFSLFAWVQAKRAKAAAEQARDQVLARTLADEFEGASSKMEQLLDFIRNGRLPEAGLRADELASSLSEIPHRRSALLGEADRNGLLRLRTQMVILSQEIQAEREKFIAPERRERLIHVCQQGRDTLRENLGRIKGRQDQGA